MFLPAAVLSMFFIHPLGCEKIVGLGKDGKQMEPQSFSSMDVLIIIGYTVALVPPDWLVPRDPSFHTGTFLPLFLSPCSFLSYPVKLFGLRIIMLCLTEGVFIDVGSFIFKSVPLSGRYTWSDHRLRGCSVVFPLFAQVSGYPRGTLVKPSLFRWGSDLLSRHILSLTCLSIDSRAGPVTESLVSHI